MRALRVWLWPSKNGEIDCMFQYAAGLSGNYVPAIQELDHLNVGEEVNLGGPILEFNFQDALMSDLDMRNAVYYALDYELLAATDGGEYCVPGTKGVISRATSAMQTICRRTSRTQKRPTGF